MNDMVLRSATTGAFEVYNISNNLITGATSLAAVGLEWQVAGFGDFNHDGTTDMMLRNSGTEAGHHKKRPYIDRILISPRNSI